MCMRLLINRRRIGLRFDILTFFVSRQNHFLVSTSCQCRTEFLGANVLDEQPFIVMPYLKHGNARDYIRHHPDCDRLRIVRIRLIGINCVLTYFE
jgi:hypothetical protein